MNPPKNLCLSAATVLLFSVWATMTGYAEDSSCIEVDYRALVSQSDLIYQSPVGRPVEGQPIGNGRMGTLVWTTPSAICLQINRNDVFAANKNHAGRFMGPVDQCWGACAQIAIDVGGQPFVAGKAFVQRLSLYEAQVTIAGEAVGVRCFVSAATDLLALEIDDRRSEPQPVRVAVSMWRAPQVTREAHVAQYEFVESADVALVVQRFREKDYHCDSAVAARFVEGGTQVQVPGERARTVVARAKNGKRTIFISSAASWTPRADVGKTAVELLGTAGTPTYDDLFKEHARWWRDFWSRTFVYIASEDGLARFVQQIRYLHLYYMASSSRGTLPAKWNGSLFITDGEARFWGSQFWVWTTEMLYIPLLAADAGDLAEPFFDMYVRQLPDCEKAARQRWNAEEGAFFPETTPFDGPVVLPDDVAEEYRDIFFGRKDPKSVSASLRSTGSFEGHLDAVTRAATSKQYSYITHVASSGSELAVHAWWRYRHTGNTAWLRTRAYPLLRGTVEFYRHLLKKDQDGCYHLYGTNAHEDFWGLKDSIMDLAAIRGTAPLAIRAAETLGVDAELRNRWQEMLDNLTPYPLGDDPQSKMLKDGVLADDVWAVGRLGDLNDGHRNSEDVWLTPVFPFEDWTLETHSPKVDEIVQKVLGLSPRHQSVLRGDGINTAIRMPIIVARAGRGEELPVTLASYYAALGPNLSNGMSLFEAASDPSIEHLGLISTALQEGLLQSVSARPGGPEIISVFPAWPKHWEASFRLLARGGFLVTAAMRGGKVEFVEIESRGGEPCRLRNPWHAPCQVAEIGGGTWPLSGELLSFDTAQGKRYRVVPKDGPPPTLRRIAPAPSNEPTSFSFPLSNGKIVGGTLGRRIDRN
jgi:hypothetical protein